MSKLFKSIQGPIAQTVVSQSADPEVMGLIPARFHTFVDIDREIIYTVIFLLLIQEGLLSITSEKYVHKVLVNHLVLVKLAREKSMFR